MSTGRMVTSPLSTHDKTTIPITDKPIVLKKCLPNGRLEYTDLIDGVRSTTCNDFEWFA